MYVCVCVCVCVYGGQYEDVGGGYVCVRTPEHIFPLQQMCGWLIGTYHGCKWLGFM